MTAARPRKPRAGRRGYDDGKPSLIEWLNQVSNICGTCYGHRVIWCPICMGFEGCPTCHNLKQVACPDCAGGHLLPATW